MSEGVNHGAASAVTRLQRQLADRIIRLIHEDGLPVGARLSENGLAARLEVSRSPVRAALKQLVTHGILTYQPKRGMALASIPRPPPPEASTARPEDELLVRISRDRYTADLGDELSETAIMRRYDAPRQLVRSLLTGLEELGMVERKPGYGWRLLDRWDRDARAESYAMRRLIEPAAILHPRFSLSPEWIATMRARHDAIVSAPWIETSSIVLFEMNADYHEGLAAASGNRHFFAAIRRLNQLRRFSSYYWRHDFGRVRANHAEHMEILDRIERGEMDVAAALMRRHLDIAEALPFERG